MNAVIVRRGDNVVKIARGLQERGLSGASLEQVIVALYQKNPGAFAGNMLRLKHTRTVDAPTPEEVDALPRSAAAAMLREHRERWEVETAMRTPLIAPRVEAARERVDASIEGAANAPLDSPLVENDDALRPGLLLGLVGAGWAVVGLLANDAGAIVVHLRRGSALAAGVDLPALCIRSGQGCSSTFPLLSLMGPSSAVAERIPDGTRETEAYLGYACAVDAAASLAEALVFHPHRYDVTGALLDLHYRSKNRDGFLQIVGHVVDRMDGKYAAEWGRIARMGRELDPGAPAFGDDKARELMRIFGVDGEAGQDIPVLTEEDAAEMSVADEMIPCDVAEAVEAAVSAADGEALDDDEESTKFELAGIYRGMGENEVAIDIYRELADGEGRYRQESQDALRQLGVTD